jgi:cytochrome c-type biogenesis protein CcmH/NrfF
MIIAHPDLGKALIVLTLFLVAFIVLGVVTLVTRIRREARHQDPMRDETSWGDQ